MYIFEDALKMSKLHPDTFYYPSAEELATIKEGTFVKVSCNNERFWIEVTDVDGEYIHGTIGNDLVCEGNEGLRFGDPIIVRMVNVYNIMQP